MGEKTDDLGEVDVINVTDENFTAVLSSLYLFPADYNGKEINLQGFVYRQAGFATNQFVLARLKRATQVSGAGHALDAIAG